MDRQTNIHIQMDRQTNVHIQLHTNNNVGISVQLEVFGVTSYELGVDLSREEKLKKVKFMHGSFNS